VDEFLFEIVGGWLIFWLFFGDATAEKHEYVFVVR
jgi:hypothetical protein